MSLNSALKDQGRFLFRVTIGLVVAVFLMWIAQLGIFSPREQEPKKEEKTEITSSEIGSRSDIEQKKDFPANNSAEDTKTYIYEDGATYTGELYLGLPNGKGIKEHDEWKWTGNFLDGLVHGTATMESPKVNAEGDFAFNYIKSGTMWFAPGTPYVKFDGKFRDGHPQDGIMTFNEGFNSRTVQYREISTERGTFVRVTNPVFNTSDAIPGDWLNYRFVSVNSICQDMGFIESSPNFSLCERLAAEQPVLKVIRTKWSDYTQKEPVEDPEWFHWEGLEENPTGEGFGTRAKKMPRGEVIMQTGWFKDGLYLREHCKLTAAFFSDNLDQCVGLMMRAHGFF